MNGDPLHSVTLWYNLKYFPTYFRLNYIAVCAAISKVLQTSCVGSSLAFALSVFHFAAEKWTKLIIRDSRLEFMRIKL